EVQQAETALAARDEDVIVARQQVDMEDNQLKDLLEIRAGDPLHAVPLATEPLPAVDIAYPAQEEALALALKQRLDLQWLYLTVENQKIRLAFSQNQKLPRLDLGTTFGINGLSGEDRPVSLFGHQQTSPHTGDYGDAYASMVEDDGYQWALDLKLTYPIGNRAARARHAKLGIEKRQLLYQVKRLEGGIETAVNNSLVTVQRSLERLQVARRFENLAQITLEQEVTRLKEGLSDTFRILNCQVDLVLAHLKRVKATTDFHQGLARLYREMGGNLERYGIIGAVDGPMLDQARPAH
nr:TolC family protein [Deltaproteobacteria bacterium]